MLKRIVIIALLFTPSMAFAQDYAPPDQELWTALKTAIGEVSAPAKTHQQIANIIQSVEREAQARAARAKAKPAQPAAPLPPN